MTRTRLAVLLAALLAAGLGGVAGAQEEEAAVELVKVPVKRHKVLAAPDVYRAAIENRQVDVRFEDTFQGRTAVPDAVAQATVAGVDYYVVAAFRTGADLVCLVPSTAEQALRALFGLGEDWPLTADVLDGRMVLNRGQRITVEGTVAGTAVAEKFVLADAVLLDGDDRAPIQTELLVFQPGSTEPDIIAEPDRYILAYPCTNEEGEVFEVGVTVRAMSNEALLAELARVAASYEGMANARKDYGVYAPGVVYRYVRDGEQISVDFTDRVARVIGYEVPEAIAAAPALRAGMAVRVPVGFAFETAGGVTVLVPADRPTLMTRAANVLTSEQVRVRGTVIGPRGAYQTLLADYIGFPAQEAAPGGDQNWVVTVEWPGAEPRIFWDYGLYLITDLPCQYVEGRFEALQLWLRQFRLVEVPVAVEEEAPAEEPAEEPEEEPEEAPEEEPAEEPEDAEEE
jgi:hypothetical protein